MKPDRYYLMIGEYLFNNIFIQHSQSILTYSIFFNNYKPKLKKYTSIISLFLLYKKAIGFQLSTYTNNTAYFTLLQSQLICIVMEKFTYILLYLI